MILFKGKKLLSVFLAFTFVFTTVLSGSIIGTVAMNTSETSVSAATSRQVENLDRGLTAISTSNGVYLSWRYLGTDSSSIGFNVYRNGVKVNSTLITNSTNYLDASGTTSSTYYVQGIISGSVTDTSDTVSVQGTNYFDINLNKPSGGTTPDGTSYTYSPNDASVADLDGDGEYEIILKWDPSNSKDNSQDGYTGNVIIDAYKLNGTQLWRIDLGINIRAGAHYTQFMVYDFDGDGYAEMVCKTADGTTDGTGSVIGSSTADYRNSAGRILSGSEYLTLFDGRTGAAIHTINYEPGRGTVSDWGDSYGNRCDRFLATVAYLNGQTPSVVMCRGYYTRCVLVAYNIVGKRLVKQWTFDTNSSGNSAFAAQGNHNLAAADVDNDGYDEIVYGACTIDHNGTGLYSSSLGHGDALHVGDFLPSRSGLEIWSCFETSPYGVALRDARTGAIIFNFTASSDTGRALAGNFISGNNSAEFVSSASTNVYNGSGTTVAQWSDITKWNPNFPIYWDGDLEQEVLDRTMVDSYDDGRLLTASGVTYTNSSKGNCSLCADILGDWREEIIWPTTDGTALRVYQTTITTSSRVYTLMHNTQYRCQIASQNVGYNQPAHTNFFLGTGYSLPAQPSVYVAASSSNSSSSSSTSYDWNFSNSAFSGLGTISSNTTVNNLTLVATSSKTMSIGTGSVSYGGNSYSAYLSLGGSGSTSYRALKFTVNGSCTITVTGKSSGSSTRYLAVCDASGNQLGTLACGSSIGSASYSYTGSAGTLYLYSTGSGINLYEVAIS